jgi:hypothetical protein
MAEKGTSAPSYRLSQGTQSRVARAGLGGDARKHLQKATMADEVGKIATGIKDQIVKKQEDRAASLAEWDAAFDEMSETGAWANENLFGKFEEMEKSQRELYVEAVRKGDKNEMAKLMKGQASRSSSLQQWKGTLEAAQKIHNGVGWSEGFMDDSEESVANRKLLTALAKMDGDMASNMEFEDGRMVFNVDGKKYTRREIDELVAEGAKPIALELNYLNDLKAAGIAGAEGKPFNEDRELKIARMSIKNEDIKHLMKQDMGGGGSFSEHIKSHTDFIDVFKTMDLTYTSTVKVGDKQVSVTDESSPGGEEITEEELKNFNDDDLNTIIAEMQKTPDTAREYLAEYKMLQMQTAHDLGSGKVESQFKARRSTWNNLTESEREQMRTNPPPEFKADDGTFDTFKFLGYTS